MHEALAYCCMRPYEASRMLSHLSHAGFAFGEEERVVYLSDLSSLPADSIAELTSRPIHILVLDALLRKLLVY